MVKFMESAAELNTVVQDAAGKLVVIDFTASWVCTLSLQAPSILDPRTRAVWTLPHDRTYL